MMRSDDVLARLAAMAASAGLEVARGVDVETDAWGREAGPRRHWLAVSYEAEQ